MLSRRIFLALPGALPQGVSAEDEIRAVLDRQVIDWNRGDIAGFMEGYATDCQFVGKTITRGRDRVTADYRWRYPTREHMGNVTFSELEIAPLGTEHASVIGRWQLERSGQGGGSTGGLFTLLFRRTPAGWRIILDHTSS